MKITREALKNIVKETMIEESEYQEFFKRALEKAGKSIPDMSDEEKKKFFNNIEKTWKGKGAKNERFGRGEEENVAVIKITDELEEAQSPAQKAAFAKMLAKKDGKDESTDKKEEVKESVNEAKNDNLYVVIDFHEKGGGFVMTKPSSKKLADDSARSITKTRDITKREVLKVKDARKIRGLAGKQYLKEQSIIKEGFATWEMSFDDMNLNGVKLSKKNKYKVKARNTVEAIKKAAKMAGLKGNDWIATQTYSLKKIG